MQDMLHYIEAEPQIYADILANRQTLLSELLDDQATMYKNVVIFATGSSSNAAFAAQPYMSQQLGIPVFVEEPSFTANYMLHLQPDTLYIAISQGGHSYSTIEMVKRVQAINGRIYTITGDENSPIAKLSQHVIPLGMPIEEMPYVTAGYSATILTLMLLALELGKQDQASYQTNLAAIENIVTDLPRIIDAAKEWVAHYSDVFDTVQRVIFVGYGGTYGVAREGETKITETVRITALGKEVEEYMHGPYIGLHASDHVIFIEPNGKLQERVAKLQKFLTGKVAKVVRITNGQVDRQDDLGLALPTDELLAPLFMTIPIHLLAYTASARKQINLKVSAFPDFDPITNSKI